MDISFNMSSGVKSAELIKQFKVSVCGMSLFYINFYKNIIKIIYLSLCFDIFAAL